ncbi:MAG: hypothetical protein GX750_04540 [Clostridia bacterium]|nr:hypothetical protein [Clostridia bacterium]
MLKLIKYEWLRRWKLFLAGIVTFLAANMSLMSNLMQGAENPRTLTAVLIGLCFALSVVLFIDHVGRLYRTLFGDEGYLELAVPLRGYQLLGGKLLAVIVECIAVIGIIILTIYLDALFIAKAEALPFGFSLSFSEVLTAGQLVLMLLSAYIGFLTTIYLSMTLAKTVFASFRHGRLIAFGCFLAISWLLEKTHLALSPFTESATDLPDILYSGTDWVITVAMLLVLFLSTSYLLDRKINL